MSIAIDGPAGAGKSTIAQLLAAKFNLMYINTGAMYRAVTLMALKNNIKPEDTTDLIDIILNMNMYFKEDRLFLNDQDINEEITTPFISNNVSNYAAIPEVRQILVSLQQEMSKQYDVIMDGRDIGTVVLKDSKFKFYITASAEERAKRRFSELINKGLDVNLEDILGDIMKRDYIDMNRDINPLTKAVDAIAIDTSFMNINQVVELISSYIKKEV